MKRLFFLCTFLCLAFLMSACSDSSNDLDITNSSNDLNNNNTLGNVIIDDNSNSNDSNDSKDLIVELDNIVLSRTGMYTLKEFAIQNITITKEGLLYEIFSYDGSLTSSTFTKIEEVEFNKLEVLLDVDLEDKYYSNIPIADVGQGELVITMGDEVKTVLIKPYITQGNPEEISLIINYLDELTLNSNSPFEPIIESNDGITKMSFHPMQCEQNIWQDWYNSGEINYIDSPTQEQLITDYYNTLGVEIENVKRFQSDLITCQACSICSAGYHFEIEIDSSSQNILLEDGWEIIN